MAGDGTARVWNVAPATKPTLDRKLVTATNDYPPGHVAAAVAHTGLKQLALWVDMVAWNADDRCRLPPL